MVIAENISKTKVMQGKDREYKIRVLDQDITVKQHKFKENDIYHYCFTNSKLFYEKVNNKPKHHVLGKIQGQETKCVKFTKGIRHEQDNIFSDPISVPAEVSFITGEEINLWFTDDAYWHFVYEDLPNLKHFTNNNAPILTYKLHDWQHELVSYFPGISDRLVEVRHPCVIDSPKINCYTETGVDTSLSGNSYWANQFVAEHLKAEKEVLGNAKVYITRDDADARKLLNDKEVSWFLQSRGFEIVNNLSAKTIKEKLEIFSNAKIILSAHGSNLCHAHAMKKGSTVIDFNHRDELLPEISDCAFNCLAPSQELEWYSITAKTADQFASDRNRRNLDKDMILDLEKVDKILNIVDKQK